MEVIIIGAGLAGLSAARRLMDAGVRAVLLEKSRGLGGRAATRRIDGIPVDHGAQFFTARSPAFCHQVETWREAGVCFEWSRGFHRFADGRIHPPDAADSHPRYACAEGMTALAKHLAPDLEIHRGAKVTAIRNHGTETEVECEDGTQFTTKRLILTAPLPQALELTAHLLTESDRRTLAPVAMDPCFVILAESAGAIPEWRGLKVDSGALSWIGADFTKRANRSGPRWLVLHSSGEFAREHYETALPDVAERLINEAGTISPDLQGKLTFRDGHRWRYARVVHSLEGSGYRSENGLYFAGDAFGATIESAWLSGRSGAELMISNQIN